MALAASSRRAACSRRALAGLASALEIERVEDYGGGVAGGDAGQTAAGVGAGAGEEQGLDGGAVVRQGR